MKHLILGTAGHIDHGKTALIKALTNIDCDTHKEEKIRGITINLGFSYLNLPNGESLGIIDVPGHRDFINTMVSGACGIDLVLLVISADSGIMPQTVEHVNIITALGIKKGIVALAKTDLVDDELIEMARYEISDFLDKTTLKNSPVVAVSAMTGRGLDELVTTIQQTMIDIEEPEKSNLFRLYIDRLFTVKGFGSVVTGSVLGGSIETGMEVYLLPGINQKFRVRSIERHGQPVDKVFAGDRAAINLIGMKSEDFERGMIISDKQLASTEMVDACITLFQHMAGIAIWSQVSFISGTFECQARLHLLNKDEVLPGEDAIVQIHLNRPAVLMNKDKFILRNSSADTTIGGGFIIDATPLHHKRRTPKLTEYLTRLSTNILGKNSLKELAAIELKKEFRPFTTLEIAEKLNIKLIELQDDMNEGELGFQRYQSGEADILCDTSYDQAFKENILKSIKDYHVKNFLLPGGLDTGEIAGKLGFGKMKPGKAYLEFLLSELKANNIIELHRGTWILKGHKPLLDKQTSDEISWLENLILKCEDEKPVLADIEEQCTKRKIHPYKLKTYLGLLADEDKIRFYQSDFIHTAVLAKCRKKLMAELVKYNEGIDIQAYKAILGGTKRFRSLVGDLLEAEKSITMQRGADFETRIFITETGKQIIDGDLS
ncbi:MAG: selenocysteine-specific translation elongation factor [Bacteroidales bacterium]|nr:selenocysteine-specific translation elongation factor [Bacteroidales bacterium]